MTVTEEKTATNQCKTTAASVSRMSQLSQSMETGGGETKQGLTPALFGAVGSKCDIFLVSCSVCFNLGGKNPTGTSQRTCADSAGNTQIPLCCTTGITNHIINHTADCVLHIIYCKDYGQM